MKNHFLQRFAYALTLVLILNVSVKAQQFQTVIDGWNAYVHLPGEYNPNDQKKYPLIVFLPGIGETGTTASKLLVNGPSKFIAEGHNMEFMVNGVLEKPIVISIQPSQNWTSPWQLNPKIDSIIRRWKVDTERINLTGLSMGGQAWMNYVSTGYASLTNRAASLVIMSAPQPDNGINSMAPFSANGGRFWGFEGTTDYRQIDMIHNIMNNARAGASRYTEYVGGHCCWNTRYNPDYNENGESIYTWMLKQRRPSTVGTPFADAGQDTITAVVLPSIDLRGQAEDPNGFPIDIQWTKIGGPANGQITNSGSLETTVSSLELGTYQFELRVTNSIGTIVTDTVTVINGMLLPVKLTDFSGYLKPGGIEVRWTTEAEINSELFNVQRSYDGVNFTQIGEVAAVGNSTVVTHYNFFDAQAREGDNFYRLEMVDNDGSARLSFVIHVRYQQNNTTPTTTVKFVNRSLRSNRFDAVINSTVDQTVRMFIVDVNGRIFLQRDLQLRAGDNRVNSQIGGTRGMYFIKLAGRNESISTGLIHE